MSKLRVMQVELEVINIFAGIINEGIARGTFKKVDFQLAVIRDVPAQAA